MRPNPQFSGDLVTFTEEILSRKLHFLWSASENPRSTQSFPYYLKTEHLETKTKPCYIPKKVPGLMTMCFQSLLRTLVGGLLNK